MAWYASDRCFCNDATDVATSDKIGLTMDVIALFLLAGSTAWGLFLLPFVVTPLVIVLAPGYAMTAGYWKYVFRSQPWSYVGQLSFWLCSVLVHGSWLAIFSYEASAGRASFDSLAAIWWIFAVTMSVLGLTLSLIDVESMREPYPHKVASDGVSQQNSGRT